MKQTTRLKTIRFLPLILFVWLWANSQLFVHAHQIGDILIVHSHAGAHNHQHSAQALQTIHFLGHFDSAGSIGTTQLLPTYVADSVVLYFAASCTPRHTDMQALTLRGPPALA